MFSSHMPDVVVLDLGLPDADGMEFLKAIRKDSYTPVIVLSARSNESDKVDALDAGANDQAAANFHVFQFFLPCGDSLVHQLGERALLLPVRAEARGVLRNEAELANAKLLKSARLFDDLFDRAASVASSDIGDRAVGASVIAALGDL